MLGQLRVTFCIVLFYSGHKQNKIRERSKGISKNAIPGAEGLAGWQCKLRAQPGVGVAAALVSSLG